jgi:hypothetical protein
MKKAGPPKRHRDHTAEPVLRAVVEVDGSACRRPGHLIVGISVSTGGLLVINGDFDCAIFAVNIRGGNHYAVADLLLKRDCQFVLTTGYSDWSLPNLLSGEKWRTVHCSTKDLEKNLQTHVNQVASSGDIGPGPI